MRLLTLAVVVGLTSLIGACQSIPRDMTVAEFCQNERNQYDSICKLNSETNTRIAATDMRVSEARAIAEQARIAADAANARQDQMYCETRRLRNTAVGSCSSGYTMTSCTQTRFTTRSGGPAIMRSINDQQCRFNTPVLEMQVRCCMAGAAPAPTEAVVNPPTPRERRMQRSSSPRPVS